MISELDLKYNILDEVTPPNAPLSAKYKRLEPVMSSFFRFEIQTIQMKSRQFGNFFSIILQEFCILHHSGASSDHYNESYRSNNAR